MHGSRRPAPDEAHAHKYRRYQWAVESSLAQLGFAVDQQLPTRGCHALGVAVVKPGLVWDGPLSPWPAAALTQRAYHQQAVNAYYVEVVQMYKFPQPKRLHLRRDGARGTEVAITLSVDCMVFEPLGLSGSQPIPGQPAPAGLLLTPKYAVQLAAPLADLVARGSINQVVLLSHWTRLWSEFPPPEWQGCAPAPAVGSIDLSMSALVARSASLASKLQNWAPILLQQAAGDSAALRTELEKEVAWLQALGASGSQGAGNGGTSRWSSPAALLYFRAASELKSVQSLPSVIAIVGAAQLASSNKGTAEMVSNESLIQGMTANNGVKPPSATTLRRMCFAIDAGAMLLERSKRSRFRCAASYGWADSSPQGGRDWLLTKLASHRWNPEDAQRPGIVDLFKQALLLICSGSEDGRREADPARLELRKNAISILRCSLTLRVLPPAAIGLRRANLAHKAAAFVHSIALETNQSIECLEAELSSLVSFTTDLGTEASIPDFRCVSPLELMPSWMRQAYEGIDPDLAAQAVEPADAFPEADIEVDEQAIAEDPGSDIMPDGVEDSIAAIPEPQQPVCVGQQAVQAGNLQPIPLLKFAIPIPGLLHIFSNALHDVMYGLKCWETYKGQLKELSTLLCYKFRLDLFVATCLNHHFNLLVLEARKLFSKSLPSLHEQRWGSLTSFITGMLIRLPMLQTFWNTRAFASCRSQATAGDEFDAAAIGAIITDPFFAAYSEMLQCLQAVITDATIWAEGCPCHCVEHKPGHSHRAQKLADSVWQAELGSQSCPLAGRRAPELATGMLQTIIAELSEKHISLFSIRRNQQLSENQRSKIASDFEAGKRHLEAVLVVKLDHWKRLPWMLCGLAHHDGVKARQAALACIAEYDKSASSVRHQHHELTKKLLTPGTALRKELEAFAGGDAPGQQPAELATLSQDFRVEVARLRFIPVVEREIEAKHKDLKHSLVALTRHGPARASMGLRSSQLWEELAAAQPKERDDFLQLLDETRVPSRAAALLGFATHPLLTLTLREDRSRSGEMKALEHATYRCDIAAQFLGHDEASALNTKAHKSEKQEAEAAARSNTIRRHKHNLADSWLGVTLPEYMRLLSSTEDEHYVFSLPCRPPFGDAVLPSIRSLADVLCGPAESDEADNFRKHGNLS